MRDGGSFSESGIHERYFARGLSVCEPNSGYSQKRAKAANFALGFRDVRRVTKVSVPGKPYFTEDQAEALARYIHAAAVIIVFCLPVIVACGIEDFFQTSRNVLLRGQGMQVMLILISIFSVRFHVSMAVFFVLWKRGRLKEFRPYKHPIGRTPLQEIEYFAEEDKARYGRLISFVFLPVFFAAISFGWFLMASNHCP